MEAMWWLRAAPDVVSAHQPLGFLRWRGLRPVRGWWCLFLANQSDPRDLRYRARLRGRAGGGRRDEEMLAARRACEEASAARPRDPTRELEAHEAYQQILARKQKERETRAALEAASIPFEAEQYMLSSFISDESSDER